MSTTMSIDRLTGIEQELEYELAEANHRISAWKRRTLPEEWEGGGDNTPLTETADAMQAIEQRDLESGHLAKLVERATALQEALGRVEAGSYGECERCRQSIDPERLLVLPEAFHCVRCEELLEARPCRR